MRIAHYLTQIRLEHGGVVRAVLDTCAMLSAAGHAVSLLTWDARDVPASWRAGAPALPSVIDLPRPDLPRHAFSHAQLRSISPLIHAPDVLHLHGPWESGNAQFARLRRRDGRPYFVTVHGMLDDWCMAQGALKKRLYLAMAGRRMLEGAAAVLCTAEGELAQAKRWFPRGHAEVLPLPLDTAQFADLPGPEPARRAIPAAATDEPILLFLSRLHPKKGPDLLIETAAALRARGLGPFRVLLAGAGDAAYIAGLRALAERSGIAACTHFVGMVGGALKLSLYQAARVFVLPTHQENFGLVLPEALACGTPVITTRGVDIWSELRASGGAVIADRSTEALADAIAPLLDDAPRARAMGRAGRAWALGALDPAGINARLESLYARAGDAARPRTAEVS